MLWTDLELECDVPDEHLREAWRTAFGIEPDAVTVIDEIALADPWSDPRIRIVLERWRQPGDFPLHVMVILGDEKLDAMVADWEQELAMVRRLCAELDCPVLISDDTLNPYQWILVGPTGDTTTVHVDPDQLDDANAFVLSQIVATPGTSA